MVSDFGTTRYCGVCGFEIIRKGDAVTMSENSKFCECDKKNYVNVAETEQ